MVASNINQGFYTLTVQSGSQTNQTFTLEPGQHFIGRDKDNQIQLNDPTISSRHALLQVQPEGVWIQDLGSSNGTFVNGQCITQATWLNPGDNLQIGPSVQVQVNQPLATPLPQPTAAIHPPAASPPAFHLSVLEGLYQGQTFELYEGSQSIGRDPSNEVVILDESLSRNHARITVQAGQVWIEDLRSTNGTFVNGQRITQPTRLGPKSVVQLGLSLGMKVQAGAPAVGRSSSKVPAQPAVFPRRSTRKARKQARRRLRKGRLAIGITAGLLAFAALFAGAYFAYQLLLKPESQAVTYYRAPGPIVELNTSQNTGDEVLREWQMTLIATARDADGVTRGELVVDGEILVQYENSASGYSDTFSFTPSLVPHELGWHTLVARAYNTQGEMGQSSVLRFMVVDPEPGQVLAATIELAEEGETIQTIANEVGVDVQDVVDANPGFQADQALSEGETIVVPELVFEPEVISLPDPTEGFTVIADENTQIGSDVDTPPTPEGLVIAGGGCDPVKLTWNTLGDDFRRYIISYIPPLGAFTEVGLMEVGETAPDQTEFELPPETFIEGEKYTLVVEAESPLGFRSNHLSQEYATPFCKTGPAQKASESKNTIVSNFGDLMLSEDSMGVSDIYCYQKIGHHGLYNRVPTQVGRFLRHLPGRENVFPLSMFSSPLSINAPDNEDVPVEMDCYGWLANKLIPVGRFQDFLNRANPDGDLHSYTSENGAVLEAGLSEPKQFCTPLIVDKPISPDVELPDVLNLYRVGGLFKLDFSTVANQVVYSVCDPETNTWLQDVFTPSQTSPITVDIGPVGCAPKEERGRIQVCYRPGNRFQEVQEDTCSNALCYPEYKSPASIAENQDLHAPYGLSLTPMGTDLFLSWDWLWTNDPQGYVYTEEYLEGRVFQGFRIYRQINPSAEYSATEDGLSVIKHAQYGGPSLFAELLTPIIPEDTQHLVIEDVNKAPCGTTMTFWVEAIVDNQISPKSAPFTSTPEKCELAIEINLHTITFPDWEDDISKMFINLNEERYQLLEGVDLSIKSHHNREFTYSELVKFGLIKKPLLIVNLHKEKPNLKIELHIFRRGGGKITVPFPVFYFDAGSSCISEYFIQAGSLEYWRENPHGTYQMDKEDCTFSFEYQLVGP